MRRETSHPRTSPVSTRVRLAKPLADGVVTLRLPAADDVAFLRRWASPELLEGVWISGVGPTPIPDADAWAAAIVTDLIAGWSEDGSIHASTLVIDEVEPFVGLVYLTERPNDSIELSYGVAPPFRRRGIATRAARVVSDWLFGTGAYRRVELRIAESHPERMVVAERAGFRLLERVETYVEGTGQAFVDVVFVRDVTR